MSVSEWQGQSKSILTPNLSRMSAHRLIQPCKVKMKFLTQLDNSQKRKIALLTLSIFVIVLAMSLYVMNALYSAMGSIPSNATVDNTSVDNTKIIEIAEGSSLSRVSSDLAARGYLRHPNLFKLLARLRGVESAIKTGEYEIDPAMSAAQLLSKIVQGEVVQYRVTLVEGWTFQQALDEIWKSEKVLKTLAALTAAQMSEQLGLSTRNPEGLLYPDTYFYTKGVSDLELLQRANQKLSTMLNVAWAARALALPYATPYEALIMASIIEKESARNTERGLISAVFVTRLKIGMRLQSDPTVIYGMGSLYAGNIARKDLLEETPYNTYRINGLPPTPIALSSEESIRAALAPSNSDYLYFVARGDGSHQFSRNLEEHNAAVQQHQSRSNN